MQDPQRQDSIYHRHLSRAKAKALVPPGFGTPETTHPERHLTTDMDKKEIAKKNYLAFIIKNVNVAYL